MPWVFRKDKVGIWDKLGDDGDEEKYLGEHKDNLLHGHGIGSTSLDGTKYEGQYRNGRKHGYGIYHFPGDKDEIYMGNHKEGFRDGVGVHVQPKEGKQYEGEWKKDKKNGYGVATSADSSSAELWEDGTLMKKIRITVASRLFPGNTLRRAWRAQKAAVEAKHLANQAAFEARGISERVLKAAEEATAAASAEQDSNLQKCRCRPPCWSHCKRIINRCMEICCFILFCFCYGCCCVFFPLCCSKKINPTKNQQAESSSEHQTTSATTTHPPNTTNEGNDIHQTKDLAKTQLIKMGFDSKSVEKALCDAQGDVQQALQLLLAETKLAITKSQKEEDDDDNKQTKKSTANHDIVDESSPFLSSSSKKNHFSSKKISTLLKKKAFQGRFDELTAFSTDQSMAVLAGRFNDRVHDDNMCAPIRDLFHRTKNPLLSIDQAISFFPFDMEPDLYCAKVWSKKETVQNAIANVSGDFTTDMAISIWLYTVESKLYRNLNVALRNSDRTTLMQHYFPYLRILVSALAKLKQHEELLLSQKKKRMVCRGVKTNLMKQYPSEYRTGGRLVWWQVTSTSAKLNVLENPQFLGMSGERTLFHIHTQNGVHISKFSAVPHEDEIVLLPATSLRITGILSTDKTGLTQIYCEDDENAPPLIF